MFMEEDVFMYYLTKREGTLQGGTGGGQALILSDEAWEKHLKGREGGGVEKEIMG